jgi:hypothetical protein
VTFTHANAKSGHGSRQLYGLSQENEKCEMQIVQQKGYLTIVAFLCSLLSSNRKHSVGPNMLAAAVSPENLQGDHYVTIVSRLTTFANILHRRVYYFYEGLKVHAELFTKPIIACSFCFVNSSACSLLPFAEMVSSSLQYVCKCGKTRNGSNLMVTLYNACRKSY